MTGKRLIVSTLTGFMGILLFCSIASAEYKWVFCTVELAGPNSSGMYIRLTDASASPTFTNKGFFCPEDQAKEMLAIALTAISLNSKVHAYIDPDSVNGEITSLYLNK